MLRNSVNKKTVLRTVTPMMVSITMSGNCVLLIVTKFQESCSIFNLGVGGGDILFSGTAFRLALALVTSVSADEEQFPKHLKSIPSSHS
jgi:hypothetical protein